MTNKSYINLKIWIIPIIGLVVGGISLPFLPEQIAMHFNAAGDIDQMGSKFTILIMPLISMAVLLMSNIVPVIDPKKENYAKFNREYNLIHLAVLIAILAIEFFVIATSLGVNISTRVVFSLILGGLLCVIGNYLPKIPSNYLVGIKTIWGFSNEEIWAKTHRMSGKLWFVMGLVIMASSLVLTRYASYINMAALLAIIVTPVLYSLTLHLKMKNESL